MKWSGAIIALFLFSCHDGEKMTMSNKEQIKGELLKIDSLLRDKTFAISMARGLEKAYQNSTVPPSPEVEWPDSSATIKRSFKEDKIAINIAGFYAVECGIGMLMELEQGTPVSWLTRITTGMLDSGDILLLDRFANATWKAGQPFRSLDRITRDNFISANFLSAEETKKDFDQISAAASILSDSMRDFQNSSKAEQMKKLNTLLRDKKFALFMASQMEAAYYKGQHEPPPAFLSAKEDTATLRKNAFEEKVATNIAGLYALECTVSYLATAKGRLPSETLQSILNNKLDSTSKMLFERFANATWKAGQPFRGLDRITRDDFVLASFLDSQETQKDWIQTEAAAKKLASAL